MVETVKRIEEMSIGYSRSFGGEKFLSFLMKSCKRRFV